MTVVVMAFVAQAASFSWLAVNVYNAANPDSGDWGFGSVGTVFYLFAVDASFSAGDDLFDPVTGTLVGGAEVSGGIPGDPSSGITGSGVIVYDYVTTGKAGFVFQADESFISGYYAVVAWDPNKPDLVGIYAFFVPAVGNMETAFDVVASTGISSMDAGAYQVMIPEPLTVGLALAGVALLVVQRKRK